MRTNRFLPAALCIILSLGAPVAGAPGGADLARKLDGEAVELVGLGLYEDAARLQKRSLEIWKDLSKTHEGDLAAAHFNLAQIYSIQGKVTSADRHARAERQLTEHIAAPAHGRISILIANIHAQSHEHADAAADLHQQSMFGAMNGKRSTVFDPTKRRFPVKNHELSRRAWLKDSGTAIAGLTVLRVAGSTKLLGQSGGDVLPWIDQPPPNPNPTNIGNLLKWEALESWQTPANNFFFVSHYGQPSNLNEANWRVEVSGLVARPRSLTMADIKARELHEVDFTLECSGNNILPGVFFQGGIGNARWGGARLAPLLEL